jgi:hypothetical protein
MPNCSRLLASFTRTLFLYFPPHIVADTLNDRLPRRLGRIVGSGYTSEGQGHAKAEQENPAKTIGVCHSVNSARGLGMKA